MLSADIDSITVSTVRIQSFSNETPIGYSTGFLYRIADETFLVTNWHVASGRNSQNPSISKNGRFCTRIVVSFVAAHGDMVAINDPVELQIDLNDSDGNGLCWYQHPTHGPLVDVALIRIEWSERIGNRALNDHDFFPRLLVYAGDGVFVLGFPWGLGGPTPIVPIWKSGTIASIPGVPHSGMPSFLIDSRTFKGMSGGPVICRHSLTMGGDRRISNFDKASDPIFGQLDCLCGIYSGRLLAEDGTETDLGKVWRLEVVEQIWAAKVLGRVMG